jgi:hypothetical protein
MITSRPRRLAGVSYVGFQRYFVTTCTAFRKPIFADNTIAANIATQIGNAPALSGSQLSRTSSCRITSTCC